MWRLPVFMAKSIDGSVIQIIILISNITFDALRHSDTRLFTSKEICSPTRCTVSRTFNSNSGTTLQLLFLQFLCSVARSLCFSDLFTATQCLFSCSAAHISELIFNLTCFSTNIFVNIILGALCNCAAADANSRITSGFSCSAFYYCEHFNLI